MINDMLIKELKDSGQDWNWYPTTPEILDAVAHDIKLSFDSYISILDIGAGDGNVFKILSTKLSGNHSVGFTKYAIEKSMILIDQMPADVFIVGTDFYEQSLIDKKVDVIFCNPPYSEYVDWVTKIIDEANAQIVYLVIPQRWKHVDSIMGSIKTREIDYKIVGTFSFEESEYRKARAVVDVVRLSLRNSSYGRARLKTDPFSLWFDSHFNIVSDKVDTTWESNGAHKEAKTFHELVGGVNIIERLDELYRKEFQTLLDNYKAVETLDRSLLKELSINVQSLKGSLESKIKGLKNKYWDELFGNLSTLTTRLTVISRKGLLSTLSDHTSVDFTISNAYAVVIWAIKNTNKYLDSQLLKVHENLLSQKNAIMYKSNNRILNDSWRYERSKITHYSLDYRIVHNHYNAIYNAANYNSYDYTNGLSNSAHDIISNIFVIARNLGFNIPETESSLNREWVAGKSQEFCYISPDTGSEDFMEVKAFNNGNLHFKINQKFMRKWNVEAGRLHGWIKSPVQASQEMDIPLKETVLYFISNKQIQQSQMPLLSITEDIIENPILENAQGELF